MENLLRDRVSYGAFIKGSSRVVRDGETDLEIILEDKVINNDTRILRLKIKNVGGNVVNLNSFLVADFNIPNLGIEEVLENGWGQSSFSGYKRFGGENQKDKCLP